MLDPLLSMPAPVGSKAQRLEARITARQKQLLQQAAELTGRSLTDFVIASAQEAALKAIQQHALIALGAADQKAFVEALLNPPAPNFRLRAAWRRYQKQKPR